MPAVAGRDGGAVEAVIDNQTGLVCDGNDPEAVYTAICRLIDDNELRRQLGQNASHRAQEFIWAEVIKKYMFLLNQGNHANLN